MKRFRSETPALYHPLAVVAGQLLRLPEEESRHVRSLRLQRGDRVLLLDGQGGRASASIDEIEKSAVVLRVESVLLDEAEGLPYIALGVGILSDRSRYEWCIEKGVELGAREIIPMVTERSEGHFKGERARRVAIAALKQSQRSFLPVILEPLSFAALFDRFPLFDRIYLCHESASDDRSLARFLKGSPAPARTLILIGPEGGFSDAEVSSAADVSATVVSLGDARLRAETAALAALVLVSSLSSER
jgi:16S rRNA (uracil1498-N3)-methyltransferase